MLVKGQKSNKIILVTQILSWEQKKELAPDDRPTALKSEQSSHASAKLSPVCGIPHKRWIPFITYAGFSREKGGFFHTN